jgi:Ser-tRNA(Ala) deacylase AlaX
METVEKCAHTTEREYYNDTYKYEFEGTILDIQEPNGEEGAQYKIIFDKTIFHPQGGGQPKDRGFLVSEDGSIKFEVTDLKNQDDAILHVGNYSGDTRFEVGATVKQQIDGEFRSIHAKIHSAGHLLDMAMNRCNRTDLKPGKGYHFVEGPYVEYIGKVDAADQAQLMVDLNTQCAAIIEEAKTSQEQVFRKICTYDEAGQELEKAGGVPNYINQGQVLRVLKLTPEDLGCPCGGTHVHSVPEIGRIEIHRIKKKKQNTQVSYKVFPVEA